MFLGKIGLRLTASKEIAFCFKYSSAPSVLRAPRRIYYFFTIISFCSFRHCCIIATIPTHSIVLLKNKYHIAIRLHRACINAHKRISLLLPAACTVTWTFHLGSLYYIGSVVKQHYTDDIALHSGIHTRPHSDYLLILNVLISSLRTAALTFFFFFLRSYYVYVY